MKDEPAAVGRGAHRRGTPLSVLGFRMGAVVAGGGGALAGWWHGDRRRGAAIWLVVAGGSGGWRLKMNRRPLILYPTAAKSTDQR